MKLGIPAEGFMAWGGGVDFLRIITDSLAVAVQGRDIELHLLLPSTGLKDFANNAIHALRGKQWRRVLAGPDRSTYRAVGQFAEEYTGIQLHDIGSGQRALLGATRHFKIDCLVPKFTPLKSTNSPRWIGYIFDFQHRHFPDLFSKRICANRDRRFGAMIRDARAIIVNAKAVAEDVRTFYPDYSGNLIVLPFAPSPRADWFEDMPDVLPRYGISNRFFLVSNQFWVHKNHALAFEAFAMLDPGLAVQLVCTGDTHDFRRPTYFAELQRQISKLGIGDRVKILGHICKRDQIELLKKSIALVQPTLFEGGPGGGATYDAVSLDVPVILSDIPINREVNVGSRSFFSPNSAEELAFYLAQAAILPPRASIRTHMRTSLEAGRVRRAKCGQAILDAVDHLLNRDGLQRNN